MFEIAEDRGEPPLLKQLSVFLPNQVGSLMRLTRCLDAFAIRIRGISIQDAADHAVVRLVVDRPSLAVEAMTTEGYGVFETECVGVALPEGSDGIHQVLSALLMAELNVHYVSSLMPAPGNRSVLALHTENPGDAITVLTDKGLELVGQKDLE